MRSREECIEAAAAVAARAAQRIAAEDLERELDQAA
jgi:hypothetical protein